MGDKTPHRTGDIVRRVDVTVTEIVMLQDLFRTGHRRRRNQ